MSDSEVEYDIAGALNPEGDDWSSEEESGSDSDGEIQDIISEDDMEGVMEGGGRSEKGTTESMSFPSLELSDDEGEGEGSSKGKGSSQGKGTFDDDVSSYFGAPQMKKKNAGSFAGLGLSSGSLKNIARKGF